MNTVGESFYTMIWRLDMAMKDPAGPQASYKSHLAYRFSISNKRTELKNVMFSCSGKFTYHILIPEQYQTDKLDK